MKKYGFAVLLAAAVTISLLQMGCAGAYVGVSAPIGYPTWGGGGTVTIGVGGGPGVIGRPVLY